MLTAEIIATKVKDGLLREEDAKVILSKIPIKMDVCPVETAQNDPIMNTPHLGTDPRDWREPTSVIPYEPKRKAPYFKVAEKSGWCSIYFDGLRLPCTLPASLWQELISSGNLERLQKFLDDNKKNFKEKT